MKNKIMQFAAVVILSGAVIVSSCSTSSSENNSDQDTTATPVDTTQHAPIDSTAGQSVQDSSAVGN
jgi:hypothetical protein